MLTTNQRYERGHQLTLANLIDTPLPEYVRKSGLVLASSITELRPQQLDAIEWLNNQPEPYLFVNAPTGAGKTLINCLYGLVSGGTWTYAVHTKMLQNQVAESFENLPTFKGRGNFPCLVGEKTHFGRKDVMANEGVCTIKEWCPHMGVMDPKGEGKQEAMCGYYQQRADALESPYRIANYALVLTFPPLLRFNRQEGWNPTDTMLADEAHNIEESVVSSAQVFLSARTFRMFNVDLPAFDLLEEWIAWAPKAIMQLPKLEKPPDFGLKTAYSSLEFLANLNPVREAGRWLVENEAKGVRLTPVWGSPFVMKNLFGHDKAPVNATLSERTRARNQGVQKVTFSSATLMGAEYIAETLGLPDGSWAYLDLPSTFPAANRPINYSPVVKMNFKRMSTFEGREKMQAAIDTLIDYYVKTGQAAGLIHAVSNRYRDQILTESRWSAIMTLDREEHERKINDGKPSVLVAANLTEGWDGYDDLCRFLILPKVPFPSLGDKRTKMRMQEDPRSYDHRALVAIVQGVGRGVRHKEDHADAWILDSNWAMLRRKRLDWLPRSFTDAYHHNVALPS